MNNVKTLTQQDKALLLSKSPYALPPNPSDKHFSADQIRRKMYEGLLVLFDWLNDIITQVNTNVGLENDSIAAINNDLTTIYSYFENGIAKKATADEDGSNIKATYETKTDATSKFNTNKDEIDKIKDGTTVVAKASKDEDGDNIKTYGKSLTHSLQGNATQWTFTFSLKDKSGNPLDTETQVFGGATTATAGLLSAEDKAKINAIASDIAAALQNAKTYTDNKVARANLVSVLGEASQALNGLMSATDKARLDTLYALLSDDDSDTVVDTIQEVLNIFNNYQEGADLVSALALKVNIEDIVDDLITENAGKPLSAKQGYILKGLIDGLALNKADAASVYTKLETYSKTEADDKFRTQTQVDDQIDAKLANVSALNVIADEDNNKNYTYQIKIQNGKAHLIATEVE